MYDGSQLWNKLVTLNMEKKNVGNRLYDAYIGIPDSLYTALQRSALWFPDKPALVDDNGEVVSYRRFLLHVDRLAYRFKTEYGIKKGMHIALMLDSGEAFCASFFAAVKLGAVTVPLPSKFRQEEVSRLLELSDVSLIVCDSYFAPWMVPFARKGAAVLCSDSYGTGLFAAANEAEAEPAAAAAPDDPVILMFTSGTTSFSKGVVLTNFNVMHSVETYRLLFDITPEDKTVIGVPIYYVTGLLALLGLFIYAGGTVFLHRRFNARRILDCVRGSKITFMHGSPTVFSLLLRESGSFPELPSLRILACGSSYMPEKKIRAFHAWLPDTEFRTVYGMTETSSPATVFPRDTATDPDIASCGLPIPGLKIKITDENGEELPDFAVGEVKMFGSVILREYYRLNTPDLGQDGWLSTGDIGYFNAQGFLFLTDRKKDMINRGGEKICSYDVEQAMYGLPEVREAAVVGIPDEMYGEAAAAALVLREGTVLTADTIRKRLKQSLATYKIPVKFLFLKSLPITLNGKVDKRAIRTCFEEGGAS